MRVHPADRSCASCGGAKYCIKRGQANHSLRHCPEWRPCPAPAEKKPVAGCEYCRPSAALYQRGPGVSLRMGTITTFRTLEFVWENCPANSQCSSSGQLFDVSFVINYCPHCGRDLRGD